MNKIKSIIIVLTIFISFDVFAGLGKDSIVKILKTYREMNTIFKKSLESNDNLFYKKMRDSLESYSDNVFIPALDELVLISCSSKDSKLINLFLDVLVSSGNSANEVPAIKLGEIFYCNPLLIKKLIIKHKKGKKLLIKDLELGFQYLCSRKVNEISNIEYCKTILNDLQKK